MLSISTDGKGKEQDDNKHSFLKKWMFHDEHELVVEILYSYLEKPETYLLILKWF